MSTRVEHRAAGRHGQARPGAWIAFALMVGGFAAFWMLAASSPGTIDSLWSRLRDLPFLVEAAVWLVAFPLTLSMAVWESSWAEWIRALLVIAFTIAWSYLFYPKPATSSSPLRAQPAAPQETDDRPQLRARTEEEPGSGAKRALVIYESMYGNTEQIGRAIGAGLAEVMPVDVVEVGSAPAALSSEIGLIVVGGPTHALAMSRPTTREEAAKQARSPIVSSGIGVREWLSSLEPPNDGDEIALAAAYDTHLDHPLLVRRLGSAGGSIAKQLEQQGFTMATEPQHFWVSGTQGPLREGELERSRNWGRVLAENCGSVPAPLRSL
jgi:hypothetical protein